MKTFNKLFSVLLSASMLISAAVPVFAEDTEEHEHTKVYTDNLDGTHTVSCSVEGCTLSETANCVYDQETENYIKTPGSCTEKTIYFKSCICGAVSDTETFEGDYVHTYVNEIESYATLASDATYTERAKYFKSCDCGAISTDENDTFESGKLLNAIKDFTMADFTYGETASVPTAGAEHGTATFTYSDSENGTYSETVPSDAGTHYVKAEIAESDDYYGASQVISFKINQAVPSISSNPTASSITRGLTLGASTIKGGKARGVDGEELSGTFEWKDDRKQMSTSGTKDETVVFTPDNANYTTAECTVSVKVERPASSGNSGSFSGSASIVNYVIQFNSNGGSAVINQTVFKNNLLKEPVSPQKSGYVFAGWYTDFACTREYNFTTPVTGNFILYAKWLPANEISLTIGNLNAVVFGKTVANDVAPVIRNERTMLPARFVAEALGATVEWNEESREVIITKDSMVMKIKIDSNTVTVNDIAEAIDSPAFIENNRTYMPLRYICEKLGATVNWDDALKTATIQK